MSIKDKVGQMTQVTLDVILEGEMYNAKLPHRLDTEEIRKAIVDYGVGSILNTPGIPLSCEEWQHIIRDIQALATQETSPKVPVLYGIDAVHGVNYTTDATLFPQQINMAASWNPELVEAAAAITAYETRASGIPWNFSPVLDVCRHPLWPRLWETFGEDVHLTTVMGLAMVSGYQGKQLDNPYKVSACLKHFLGYGMPLNGKDRTPAWIPERQLREYFLPPFTAAIKAGAASIMINSGEINGIPVHADKNILTGLLREELGFTGLVVTDWEDIKYLHSRHRVASSMKEAVRIAIDAGIDMSMVPDDYSFCDLLLELVEEGSISEARIDQSVERILSLKQSLGLFENPVISEKADYQLFGQEAHAKFALQLAQESITLLKNEKQQLPLSKKSKVLVTGFSANAMKYLNGGWTGTWQGDRADEFIKNKSTLLQAIQNTIGKDQVEYVEGSAFEKVSSIEAAVAAAKNCDHILLCLGEETYTEFHGNIDDLNLPAAQIQLAQAMIDTGKPITLILLQGRPRLISGIADQIDNILYAYLPGNEGGQAIADVLFGVVNPSGKLPITYPKHAHGLVTYDRKNSEISSIQGSNICYDPLWEFGTGLSYTTFEYSNLRISKNQIAKGDRLEVSVQVKNTGAVAGKEVVQLYLRDEYASITPSVKRLKAFQKIQLDPGHETEVTFQLTEADFSFVGIDHKWICEPGDFTVMIGDLSLGFVLV